MLFDIFRRDQRIDLIRSAARLVIATLMIAAMLPVPLRAADQPATSADSSASKGELLRAVMRKFAAGQKIPPAEMQEFVNAQNDGLMDGPAIGEPVPDFHLPDQNGKDWSLNQLMGPKGLLLVFTRSADWCPYCRTQLVELEQSRAAFAKQGVKIASISYDSEAALKRFATAHHIGYPMLSDQGSAVIRKFGILNTNIPSDHKFYGIPFPGEYLIAPDTVVRDKHFLPDFRDRVTASEVLLYNFGTAAGNDSAKIGTEDVKALVTLSADHAAPGHELGIAVDFTLPPGSHLYGQPLPDNYIPLTIALAPELVANQRFEFPKATPIKFAALGETLPAYTGKFRATGRVLVKSDLKRGDYQLDGTLHFQECNDQICKLPQTLPFVMPLKIDPMQFPPDR